MVIVSWEFACAIGLCATRRLFPQLLIAFGQRISEAGDNIKLLALLPAMLFWFVMTNVRQVLSPQHRLNSVLQEWPDYHMLTRRYYFTLTVCAGGAVVGGCTWVFGMALTEPTYLALFMGSVLLPLISFLSFHIASVSLTRILDTPDH